MGTYVLLHLADGGIYGVAAPANLEEVDRLLDFAKEHGIEITTGKIHSVQELIEWATIERHLFLPHKKP